MKKAILLSLSVIFALCLCGCSDELDFLEGNAYYIQKVKSSNSELASKCKSSLNDHYGKTIPVDDVDDGSVWTWLEKDVNKDKEYTGYTIYLELYLNDPETNRQSNREEPYTFN